MFFRRNLIKKNIKLILDIHEVHEMRRFYSSNFFFFFFLSTEESGFKGLTWFCKVSEPFSSFSNVCRQGKTSKFLKIKQAEPFWKVNAQVIKRLCKILAGNWTPAALQIKSLILLTFPLVKKRRAQVVPWDRHFRKFYFKTNWIFRVKMRDVKGFLSRKQSEGGPLASEWVSLGELYEKK